MHSTFLIFLYLAVLFGCTENEDYANLLRTDAAVNNSAATQLLGLLQKENNGVHHLLSMTEPYEPMLEHTSLSMSSEFGMNFIVPFGDISAHQVYGMVRYPVEFTAKDGNKVEIGDHLYSPSKVNARILNEDIDIRKRYLYSSYFKQLGDSTINKPDSTLTEYTYLQSNVEKIPGDGVQYISPTDFMEFYYTNHIIIDIYYFSTYIGNDYSAIYGLNPNTLQTVVRQCLIDQHIPEYEFAMDHYGIQSLKIAVVTDHIWSSIDMFVTTLMNQITNKLFIYDFFVSLQYTYLNFNNGSDDPSPGTGGGSYTGGSSPGGESGGSGNGDDDTKTAKVIEDDCASIENSYTIKLQAKAMVDTILNIQQYEGSFINSDWNVFSDSIATKPSIEYGMAVNDYAENGYHLSEIESGTAYNVDINNVTGNTVATVHYHPNGTPPSARDLLTLVEDGMQFAKRQASLVYTRDSIFYTLQITDRSKLTAFYNIIKNEVDSNTNDFKKKGIINKFLHKNRTTLKGLSNGEKRITKMASLLRNMNAGIQLILTDLKKETKSVTIYSVKRNKKKYKPIKCD